MKCVIPSMRSNENVNEDEEGEEEEEEVEDLLRFI